MENATDGTSSPDEVGEDRFHKKDLYLNKERMTEKQLFPRSCRAIMVAFRLGEKTPRLFKLFTILG